MSANVTDDLAAAYAARHQGQAATIAADKAVHRDYGVYIARALNVLLSTGEDFTAETVRVRAAALAHCDGRDFDPAPNLIPAYIGGAAQGERIREVGRVRSTRPERRASKISLWRPTNPAPPQRGPRPPLGHG